MTVILNRPPNLKSNVIANLIGEGALAREKLASQFYNSHSGVKNLSRYLTINGVTKEASYRYFLGDASASGLVEESGGPALSVVAVATPPTYNAGSPYHGGLKDDSCKFNESDYLSVASAAALNITTEDFVFEIIWKSRNGGTVANQRLFAKSATPGYFAYQSNAGVFGFAINDGGGNSILNATMLGDYNRAFIVVNRNEASVHGASLYINDVLVHSVDFSSNALTLTNADTFTIGAHSGGSNPFDSSILYLAMWKHANWMQAGAAGPTESTALNLSRQAQLIRTMPDFAKGTRIPTTATRAFSAHSEKLEPGRATSKLYLMGDNQIRVNSKLDKNGEYFEGVHLEPQVQNLAIQSGDASTTWALLDAGDTFDLNAIDAANGETVMDGFIADATDGIHGITQDVTMTATSTAISCYAKKGNQTFICIEDAFFANGKAFFDIDNEVVGATPGAGINALYMQPGKYNDTVRCIAIVTGTAAVHTVNFKVATADNDDTFAGDGAATNAYMWGFQIECNGLGYATSYIPTLAAAATRLKDALIYAGGANIGGEDIGQITIAMDILCPDYVPSRSLRLISINDGGSAADRYGIGIGPTTGRAFLATRATAGNSGDVAMAAGNQANGEIQTLISRCKTNKVQLSSNGVLSAIDSLADMPDDLDRIDMGNEPASVVEQPACLIRNIRIYSDPDVEV